MLVAGLFYDRVSLLAADFRDNPTRTLSFYDQTGALVNSQILQNAYITMVPGRGVVQNGTPRQQPSQHHLEL